MRHLPLLLALWLPLAATPASAQEAPPAYELPPGAANTAELDGALREAVARAITELGDPPHPESAEESVRLLAAVGAPALPAVVAGLQGASRSASWYTRATLIAATAEMDTAFASPLLRTAASDPSFAVREAAVTGLGKIGVRGDVDALLAHVDPDAEPVWRVRAMAAPAIRRAILRGVLDRAGGDAAMARLLEDPDPDVRRAALREVPQISSDAAIPALLALLADGETAPDERSLAVAALRVARHRAAEVTEALRRGFLDEEDSARAGEVGAALIDLNGADVLTDPELTAAILHHLVDAGSVHLRPALGRLGVGAAPWLANEARRLARRIAAGRTQHDRTPLELLVEALVEVRRADAAVLARELATGADAEVLDPETRRFALRKLRALGAAQAAGPDLRAQFDSAAGDGVRRALLETIVASGGDDLGERLDAALSHSDPAARFAAVDLLSRRPDLKAGDGLARLAVDPEAGERLRGAALDALARRDAPAAARIAREQATHARAAVRERAVSILGRSGTEEDITLLLLRLDAEDGGDPADDVVDEGADSGARTPSVRDPSTCRVRLRKAILAALREASPERARSVLLTALTDPAAPVRGRAARLLRGLIGEDDSQHVASILEGEGDPSVRDELLGLLATLDASPDAERLFGEMLAVDGARHRALMLLRSTDARLIPPALEVGVSGNEWDDDDRETALTILARAGRTPRVELLVRLARGATTVELSSEAMRLLAVSEDPAARAALGELLRTLEDVEKLAEAAHRIGTVESGAMVPDLIALLERWREPALRAPRGSAAAVRLYRRVAVALGRSGTDEGMNALLDHLLDDGTARAVAAYSTPGNGPFRPIGAPPVRCVRGLVSGLAHTPDAQLGERIALALNARRTRGATLRLSEGYVDGVARYLRDPEAYGLPARRRSRAALPLFRLVTTLAPRLSTNDLDAQTSIASQLQEERRYPEAAEAHAELIALRDVEDAARSPDRRTAEAAKQTVLAALVARAEGRGEEALRAIDAIRERDPDSGDLAYWHGYGRVKLRQVDDLTRSSLVHAVAADERNPTRHLYLGWVVQQSDGAAAAVAHYERAKTLDKERVHAAGGEYLTHRRGKTHLWGFYPYYLARALAAAGDPERALGEISLAVARDDRYAEQALGDPAFEGLVGLAETVTAARDAIKASDTE